MDPSSKNQETNSYLPIFTFMEDIENEHVGEELQRLAVVKQLPDLIKEDERGCREKIFPKLQQTIAAGSLELQREASLVFIHILQHDLINIQTFSRFFLFPVLFGVDRKDEVFGNVWVDTLIELIDYLPEDVIVCDILPLALYKARLSQTQRNRIISSRLLGKLATKFDRQKVAKDIFPLVLSLCQDDDEVVRSNICAQLSLVAKGLPPEMVRSSLLPILVELGQDNAVHVRCETIQTVVDIIPHLSSEELRQTIIPLVKKICSQALVRKDDTLNVAAQLFGPLCIGLEGCLSKEDSNWLITYYSEIIHIGSLPGGKTDPAVIDDSRLIAIRQQCAYNLPAMANICSSNTETLDKFIAVICDLCADTCSDVRRLVGAGLHEVVRILGKNNSLVKSVLIALLCDTKLEVLSGVLQNLSSTINSFVETGVFGQEEDASSTELGRALLHCDKIVHSKHYNWRLCVSFLTEIRCIVKCLTSDFIYTHFVNRMFYNMRKTIPVPCRESAAHTLLIFLRYNLRNSQRQEIRARLYNDYCHSPDFYQRKLFLKLCYEGRNIFSKDYFKQHFYFQLLTASNDAVSNIRMLLAQQMPYLKAILEMPSDNQLMVQYENALKSLIDNEKDRDVLSALDKNKLDNVWTKEKSLEDRKLYEEELKLSKIKPDLGSSAGIALKLDRKRGNERARRLILVTGKQNSHRSEKENFISTTVKTSELNSSITSTKWTDTTDGGKQAKIFRNGYSSDLQRSNSLSSPSSHFLANSTNSPHPLKTSLHRYVHGEESKTFDYSNSCTCYIPFNHEKTPRDENLNIRALNIDTKDETVSKNKLKLIAEKPKSSDTVSKYKLTESCKYNMAISWLNLETDLKNELYTLVANKARNFIPGDRNFKEKARFLTDFKDFKSNDKFKLCDSRINSIRNDSSFKHKPLYDDKKNIFPQQASRFEEKRNFFEEKCKNNYLEDAKSNSDFTDCSCFDLTNKVMESNRLKLTSLTRTNSLNEEQKKNIAWSNSNMKSFDGLSNIKHDTNRIFKNFDFDVKKSFNFSKTLEEDFYRDAGIKIPEAMVRHKGVHRLSNTNIPVYDYKKQNLDLEKEESRLSYFSDEHINSALNRALQHSCSNQENVYDSTKVEKTSPKNSVTNKRRTWFGTENINHYNREMEQNSGDNYREDHGRSKWGEKGLSLDYIFKETNFSSVLNRPGENLQKVKSDTLLSKDVLSLEKIGIGPRSKSFILPSTFIASDHGTSITRHESHSHIPFFDNSSKDDCSHNPERSQSPNVYDRELATKNDIKQIELNIDDEKKVNDLREKESDDKQKNVQGLVQNGAIPKLNNGEKSQASRLNNLKKEKKLKSSEDEQGNDKGQIKYRNIIDLKQLNKTKIPVGRIGNHLSPSSSRSSSPSSTKDESINKEKKKNIQEIKERIKNVRTLVKEENSSKLKNIQVDTGLNKSKFVTSNRNSMIMQTNTIKNENRNLNRRSLDSTKMNLDMLDKNTSNTNGRKVGLDKKSTQSNKLEDKIDSDGTHTSSRLPIRRKKLTK